MITFDEPEVCPVCGQQAVTSKTVGEGTTTVMRERHERSQDTGELLELPPVAVEVVTEIIVEYRCSACGHQRAEAL